MKWKDGDRKGAEAAVSESTKEDRADSVESTLFALCSEIAGALLKGLQDRQDPAELKTRICRELQTVGEFPKPQAESLVALAIELIRAKAQGKYKRDPREIRSLVGKALGGSEPEDQN